MISPTRRGCTASPGWRTSTYCNDETCVEVLVTDQFAAMRDSKNPGGPALAFDLAVWQAFMNDLKNGTFER